MIELSWKRVVLLCKMQLRQELRRHLVGGISVLALITLGLHQNRYPDSLAIFNDIQLYCLYVYLVFGVVFATSLLKPIKRGPARVNALNLPVSAADRLVYIIIFTYLLYPLVFFGLVAASIWTAGIFWGQNRFTVSKQLESALVFFGMFNLITSVVVLSAASFKRFVEVKAIAMVLLVILFNSQTFHFIIKMVIDVKKNTTSMMTVGSIDNQEIWNRNKNNSRSITEVIHINGHPDKKIVHNVNIIGSMSMGPLYPKGHISTYVPQDDVLPFGVPTSHFILFQHGNLFDIFHNLYLIILIAGVWVATWFKIKEAEL